MVGFRLPRELPIYSKVRGSNIRVQVLSNAILLKWVPTGVTRTSNRERQKLNPSELSCIPACIVPKLQFHMLNDNSLALFIDVSACL
jgi:hypothetical protein